MIVVDTSVWVGTLLNSDAHSTESLEWLDLWVATNRLIHFPMLIIPELAGVLARRGTPATEIAGEVDRIVLRQTVHLHGIDLTAALLAARVATSTGLRGADAIFVGLAMRLDVPLVSWDQQQRERGAHFCRTMTPVEAMEMAG